MSVQNPLHRAMELMGRGKTGTARALCRKVLHSQPDHFDALHLYGVLCLKDGEFARASETLRHALQTHAPAAQQAQVNSNLSLALLQQGQLAEALDAATQALDLGGDQVPFLGNRANIYEAMEDWPAMEADLRLGLTLSPDNPEFLLGLAIACRHQGRLDEAVELLHPLLNTPRQDPALLWEWALLQSLTQGSDTALNALAPLDDTGALYEAVGDYCCDNNYYEQALPFYRRACDLNPGDESLQHRLAALEGRSADQAPAAYVTRLYDSHAPAFEQRLVGRLGYRAPWLLPERLLELGYRRFERVLDLGCGTGLAGAELCRRLEVKHLEGVDLSEQMLGLAARKECYHALHAEGLLGFLQHNDQRHDLICALDVLIYLGSLEGVYEAARKRLRAGGLFAFTVERETDGDYRLQPSGRYRHGEDYLRKLARDWDLQIKDATPIPLRLERGRPVAGLLLILERE